MPTTSESVDVRSQAARRLYRSNDQRVLGGISGGLGDYFAIDPVWFRVAFVFLALAGGSGLLIYLLMWLIVPPAPNGYTTADSGRGSITGAAVVGAVFMIVGTIALVNTVAPWLGQYIWPVVFVLGGLALLLGGLSRDTDR
jgi:phage shock protein PspC (stress-responsive transcriptional regulator)